MEERAPPASNYRDLIVWQQAIELSISVYRLTDSIPGDERYRLRSQMRRSSASVAANIAEG
jgi:four helix bundle protein